MGLGWFGLGGAAHRRLGRLEHGGDLGELLLHAALALLHLHLLLAQLLLEHLHLALALDGALLAKVTVRVRIRVRAKVRAGVRARVRARVRVRVRVRVKVRGCTHHWSR